MTKAVDDAHAGQVERTGKRTVGLERRRPRGNARRGYTLCCRPREPATRHGRALRQRRGE